MFMNNTPHKGTTPHRPAAQRLPEGLTRIMSGKTCATGSAWFTKTGSIHRRLRLTRTWDHHKSSIVFVMLNPSIADHATDDPTIRRCVGFAKREGFGRLVVVNLFSLIATDPRELIRAVSPVGPYDDVVIRDALKPDDGEDPFHVVFAWGAIHGSFHERAMEVRAIVMDRTDTVFNLGITKDGHPRHPLYLPANAPMNRYA